MTAEASNLGMTTMVVSNGLTLNEQLLRDLSGLHWFVLSIDSIIPETNALSGRIGPGRLAFGAEEYLERISLIRNAGLRLKMNTVVSAFNWQEDMSAFVLEVLPERLKIFRHYE
ncbi:MAG: hypothetical protein HC898_01655 [Phycisphaerales bacterium]|nr:hypothetical protein [Phycisphaerales bacterium]